MLKPKGKLVRIHLSLDENTLQAFDRIRRGMDLSRSEAISKLIKDYMAHGSD